MCLCVCVPARVWARRVPTVQGGQPSLRRAKGNLFAVVLEIWDLFLRVGPACLTLSPASQFSLPLLQVNENFAIDLIAEQPVSDVQNRVVACDGGGGALGHPKVYINLVS